MATAELERATISDIVLELTIGPLIITFSH
jgi:hypothetical protein